MNDSDRPALAFSARLPGGTEHILVAGGSGSGKSALAEQLAVRLAGNGPDRLPLYYVATLQVGRDAENRQRVRKHRQQRQSGGFLTREVPTGLGTAIANGLFPAGGSVVLLEDLSNLLANEMFLPGGAGLAEARDRIAADLAALLAPNRHVVIVSNDIFADATRPDGWTEQYLAALGWLNRSVAARCGGVVEAVCGLPAIWRDRSRKIGEWLCPGSWKN